MAPKIITLLILLALPTAEAGTTSDWYQPTLGTTWHWQLQGPLNTDYQVEVYDIVGLYAVTAFFCRQA